MSTDYSQIREENIKRYGTETAHLALLGDLYSDRTHFIFELLQNSEDARATKVEFRLRQDALELRHDGLPFTPDDVRGISSVCRSTNEGDPERIGRFGIGFKSVYAYTRRPEVHSGNEHFAIENYVRPDATERRPVGDGFTTLIVLPFNASNVCAQEAHREIANAFNRLKPIALLFLRHVHRVEFVEADDLRPIVLQRSLVAQLSRFAGLVTVSSSEGSTEAERWLVFERPVKLAKPTGREVDMRVEAAFAVTPESTGINLCVVPAPRATLAVFFPTERPTNTGFILQGPFLPTPARDNVRQNDPTNVRLAKECAELLVDALRWLRDKHALSKAVFAALPLKRSEFPDDSLFRPLFDRVLKVIKEEPLLPAYVAQSEDASFVAGDRAKAAGSAELREILPDNLLGELLGPGDWRWLADDLTVRGDSDLALYLRDEVGIHDVTVRDFVTWLTTKDAKWWKGLDERWLIHVYSFLHGQTKEHERLKKLPIIRLENGDHVSAAGQPIFFPADDAQERQELAPFLPSLPVVQQSVLNDDNDKAIENFLRQMGVAPLVAFEFIMKCLVPRYNDAKGLTLAENRSHVRFLNRATSRMPSDELNSTLAALKILPVLICHKASDPTPNYIVKPTDAYLPAAYTGDHSLERFFSPSPDIWFVEAGYLSAEESPEEWKRFLLRLGASDLPRVSETKYGNRTDRAVEGLEAVRSAIGISNGEGCIDLAKALWSVVTRLLPEGSAYPEFGWDRFLHCQEQLFGPRGGYLGSREVDAGFFVALRDKAWVPDAKGLPRCGAELFESTSFNQKLLGEAVHFLSEEITLKTRQEVWLAEKLGIRRSPTKESVVLRLKSLKSIRATPSDVQPLYEFLDRTRSTVADEFEKEALILCPDAIPEWLGPSRTFWDDESAVFNLTRGCLKKHYPKLRDFFMRCGVAQSAGPSDYAKALLEIAEEKAADDITGKRIHRILKRLVPRFEEGGDWENEKSWQNYWSQLQGGPNWLGHKGGVFAFFHADNLVRSDNDHLAGLFEKKLPFWPFSDVIDFAIAQLGIAPCSSAICSFKVDGKGEVIAKLDEELRQSWPLVLAFLGSARWHASLRERTEPISATSPCVRFAERIGVTYELKGATAEEPDGTDGFYEVEAGILWLAKNHETIEDELVEALGDALQEFFGPEVLREFVCDLFRKGARKASDKWRKKGLILSQSSQSQQDEAVDSVTCADKDSSEIPTVESPASPPAFAPSDRASQNPLSDTSPTPGIRESTGNITALNSQAAGSRGDHGAAAASSKGQSTQGSAVVSGKTGSPAVTSHGAENVPPQIIQDEILAAEEASVTINPGKAFEDAFSRKGKTELINEPPPPGRIRDTRTYRERTRQKYIVKKQREPAEKDRKRSRAVDVWEPKNKEIRDFFISEYGGRCQICTETFPRRDGWCYFEAVYLIAHTAVAWTDEPGSVLCLCAQCSAKFQHGAVEAADATSQLLNLQTESESGSPPILHLRLVGKDVSIHFSDRHLVEMQELLKSDQPEQNNPHVEQPLISASLASSGAPEKASKALVQCPKCTAQVRVDRMERHMRRVHAAR